MNKLVVIGNPVENSLSPVMHNAALIHLKLENEFQYGKMKIETDELITFVELIRMGNIYGANVTIPHKINIKQYMDALTPEAELIGAVNTIFKKENKIIGHNTDGIGCLNALKEQGIDVKDKKIALLGAGGAARAIAFTIATHNPKKITIINRTVEKGLELSNEIKNKLKVDISSDNYDNIKNILTECDILINTTSVGMKGKNINQSLIHKDYLHEKITVMDIIYTPEKTKLLIDAEEKGCKIIKGIGMLVHQGAEAFKIWTNKEAPIDIMKKAVIEALR
jgi:shikimate dehydrogenase